MLVEACVTSVSEAVRAEGAGADRLELCVALDEGGLTPPADLLTAVVEAVSIPVFAMVRPRPGPYRAERGDDLPRAVEMLRRGGAAGFVTGWLDADGRIDPGPVADVVSAARGRPVTVHRAFDEVGDWEAALETLVELEVARVLTAGGRTTAWDGRSRLRALVGRGHDRIRVMAGGRVRGDLVVELVEATGVREVHARAEGIPGVIGALDGAGREDGP